MSATSYFCSDEPTWKLISLSVPPMNLPLIELPLFSSKESPHAIGVTTHMATTNPQFFLRLSRFSLAASYSLFLCVGAQVQSSSKVQPHCQMPDMKQDR
jgi:hypothetical protein